MGDRLAKYVTAYLIHAMFFARGTIFKGAARSYISLSEVV